MPSFEQISMQRLTGVPSPISGGAGTVGFGWAGLDFEGVLGLASDLANLG